MLRILALLATVLGTSMPAWCGDAANLNVMGFSGDGRYFAFEQYGVQDGSGFAYSDIFITDLKQNVWIKNTPLHTISGDENASISEIRTRASANVAVMLQKLDIVGPADILASNPVTEIVPDRKTVVFDTIYRGFSSQPAPFGTPTDERYELRVANIEFPGGDECQTEDGKIYGFSLSLRKTTTGVMTQGYRDEKVPKSRACPLNYEIEAIASVRNALDEANFVAIIAYYKQGFEGPDRRFIAVPINPQ